MLSPHLLEKYRKYVSFTLEHEYSILTFISTRNKAGPERLKTQLRVQTLSFHVKTKDSSDYVQSALKILGCKRQWSSSSGNGGLFYWMLWRLVLFMTAVSGHCYTSMLIIQVYGSITSLLYPPHYVKSGFLIPCGPTRSRCLCWKVMVPFANRKK